MEVPGCWGTTRNVPLEVLINPPRGMSFGFVLFCFNSRFSFPFALPCGAGLFTTVVKVVVIVCVAPFGVRRLAGP